MGYEKNVLLVGLATLVLILSGCSAQVEEAGEDIGVEVTEPGGLCSAYTKVQGQLSCEEAINEVLKDNAGEVNSIAEVVTDEGDAWLIGVEFTEPIIVDGEEVTSTTVFILKDSKTHYADLCSKYEKVLGQVSCEEAIMEVLKDNPGTITSVADVVTDDGEAWLIGVEFTEPIIVDGEEVTSTEIFRLK